ncbi:MULTISPECIES: hypothetical protein [unclassified Leptolyngbya]|uniref:hypothetical protein n=1 Tax=unclassified Leptolyngbya TaxID=2650499 RepID=UPI0016824262|nr:MULTISPECIES: hypothetical protein [unclassified Leptolyngbya]MBD1910587.1 hypothetical protein [Leptolyngbya sp. FACHB-8]MBD2155192.1 hypothetical protein [Leptolyngbya sp. FACHB-16]
MQPDSSPLTSAIIPGLAEETHRVSTSELTVDAAEYRALLREVQLARRQQRDRTTRIQELEQALDQALASISEMRLKLEEQTFLEAQLAATEKFACVQQQAIARLRLRVQQQQCLIESHLAAARDISSPHTALPSPSSPIPPLSEAQASTRRLREDRILGITATEPDDLPRRLADVQQQAEQSRELAHRLQEQLLLAHERIQELSVAFDQHEAVIVDLQGQLKEAYSIQPERPNRTNSQRALMRQNRAIATLGQDLARAQIKVEELEIELARQLRQLALSQQRHREVERESDRHQHRVASLERQTAELQEQVFYQARQIGEYEATIQHWKDQYLTSQHQILRLQELLEELQLQFLANDRDTPTLSALFSELLAVVEFAALPGEDGSQALTTYPMPRLNALELPDFLLRRRSYRTPPKVE